MNNTTKKSSYTKVCELLCEHSEFKNYIEVVRSRLLTFQVRKSDFILGFSPAPNEWTKVNIRFHLGYSGQNPNDFILIEQGNVGHYDINMYDLAHPPELREVANKIWGLKEVPTYNCRFKVPDGKSGNCIEYEFQTISHNVIVNKLADEILLAKERIKNSFVDAINDPTLEQSKKTYLERRAIDDVKASLMRFKSVNNDILRSAFDEFLCELIISE